jgi:putative chitinase
MIDVDSFLAFAPHAFRPDEQAEALEAARINSSVTTARRLCHFMGQVFVESVGFTLLEENLRYRNAARLDAIFSRVQGIEDAQALIDAGPQAIGNRVYAKRLGNGDEASGDGWEYRGSGYIQLTGRANFRSIGELIGIDLEGDPGLARDPATAAEVAFAFWDAKECSDPADDGDVEEVTRRINGNALLGLKERRQATLRATLIWR